MNNDQELTTAASENEVPEKVSSQSTDNVIDWIKAAQNASDSGKPEVARDFCLRALDLIGSDAKYAEQKVICLNLLGEIALTLNQPEVALEQYSSVKVTHKAVPKLARYLNIASVVFLFLTVLSIFLPTRYFPDNTLGSSSKPPKINTQFKTADELSAIRVADRHNVNCWERGKIWESRYVNANFSLLDCLKLLAGSRSRQERYFTFGDNFLKDEQGIVYYKTDKTGAPEHKVLGRMWWYPGFLNDYYSKLHHYPEAEEPWMTGVKNYYFKNQFTGQVDKAEFVKISDPQLTPPAVARPGAVLILIRSAGRASIIGYDRDGKLLTSSTPDRGFSIDLLEGKTPLEGYIKGLRNVADVVKKTPSETVVFMSDARLKPLLSGLEFFLPAIAVPLWFSSVTLALYIYRLNLDRQGRLLAFCCTILPTALIVLVIIMSFGDWIL